MSIRVAVAQRQMHWTIEENVASAVDAIAVASKHRADVCVFPELSVTGFHRKIRDLCIPALIVNARSEVQAACNERGVAAVVGLPAFSGDLIFNSAVFIDANGVVRGEVRKNGLTAAEATLFTSGDTRPVLGFCGHHCSAVLCREIEDIDQVASQLGSAVVDLIFWPGIMRPNPESTTVSEPYVEHACQLARRVKAYVIQANWPNSLNYPDEGAEQGQSMVVAPTGRTLLRLPKAAPGIGILLLGTNQFDWYPD